MLGTEYTSVKTNSTLQEFIIHSERKANVCAMQRKVKCCDYFKEQQSTPSLVNRHPRRRRETQWVAVGRLFTCCLVIQSCSTLCDPMECSLPGSSVHGISQARILEWAAIPFSGGFSWHRDRTRIFSINRWILYHWATRETLERWMRPREESHCCILWVQMPDLSSWC